MAKKIPSRMTNEELERLAAEVEGEFLWERSRPLTRQERVRWTDSSVPGAGHGKGKVPRRFR